MILMHSFILSFFNYCSIPWHFCNTSSARKIEKIQERALKLVYRNFEMTYEELRMVSGIPLVYVQRLRRIVIEMYKSYYKLNPPYLHNYVTPQENVDSLRNEHIVHLPRRNTVRYGVHSFTYQGAKLWNSLANQTKQMEFITFKTNMSKWYPDTCECSNCLLCKLNEM